MNRVVKVVDIAILNRETFKKNEYPNNIRYLDTGNLTKNKIEEYQYLNTNKDKIPSRAQRKVKKNTILYSTVRPNQEHYGFLEKEEKDLVVSTGFTTIDVNVDFVYPKYLYFLLTQKHIVNYLHTIGMNAVSSYPSISPTDIANLKFNFPKLPTQKAIAKVLSDIDAKIELNNKINQELETMAKTIYDYWFVQFDFPNDQGKPYKSSGGKMIYNEQLKREIPKGWEVKNLTELFVFQKGIEPGTNEYKTSKTSKDDIVFYRVADINGNTTTYINSKNKNFNLINEYNVVVSFDGSIGKVGIGLNGAYSSGLQKIYDPSKKLANSIIYMLFKDERIIKTIHKYATGSIILHASNSIKYLTIPYDETIYLKFQNIINPIYNKIIKNKIENKQLTELRDWLLPMLMNGQVTVQNINTKHE